MVADSWTRNAERYGASHDVAVRLRKAVDRLKPRAAVDCYDEMLRCLRESTMSAEVGDLPRARTLRLLAIDYTEGFLRFSERGRPSL